MSKPIFSSNVNILEEILDKGKDYEIFEFYLTRVIYMNNSLFIN